MEEFLRKVHEAVQQAVDALSKKGNSNVPMGTPLVIEMTKKAVKPQGSKSIGGTVSTGAKLHLTNKEVHDALPGVLHPEPKRAVIRDERGVVVRVSHGPPTLPLIQARAASEGPIRDVLHLIIQTTKEVFGYVIWNYQDFFQQLVRWDGSWQGLFLHTHLVMRTLITVALTYGLFKSGEILAMIWEILSAIWNIVSGSFNIFGTILEDVGKVVGMIWEDTQRVIQSVTNAI